MLEQRVRALAEQNIDQRGQNEALESRLQQAEQQLRQQMNDLQQSQRTAYAKDRDLSSLNQGLQQLQKEISHVTNMRCDVEEKLQEANLGNAALQVQVRERDAHIEGLMRENKGLLGTLEVVHCAQADIIRESNTNKDQVQQLEREKLQTRLTIENL